MAAKNKRPRRATALDRSESGLLAATPLDLRASHRHDDLLEEARHLQAAGKIREARAVEKRAAQIDRLIGALETEIRQPNPHAAPT